MGARPRPVHTLPLFASGPEKAYSGPALLAKGFRPFFFAAALFAGLILPAWSLTLAGRIHVTSYLDPVSWHAHEMLFGFAAAVIAGFLLTAVTNWTERETAVGPRLAVLVALWLAGRVVFAAANHLPGVLVAAIDLAFLPALAFTIGLPIVRSRSKRNVVVVVVVLLLSAANAAMHLDALGLAPGLRRRGALVAVDVVVLLMVLVAGRVVAMFTRNATRDESCRSHPTADRLAVAAVAAVAVLDLLTTGVTLAHVVVPLLASVTVAARAAHWGFRTAMRQPILWILHVGHTWIPIGLALRAMAAFTPSIPPSLGIHAVTAGALGALSLGMMARVALGHTGRSLVLPTRFWFAFVAVTIAAAGRLTAPFLAPSHQLSVLVASGVLWALAFVSYAVAFAPILLAPRIDGKAG
ncbi:MAG: NnrS family protein [Polyangiaceae bacterium]